MKKKNDIVCIQVLDLIYFEEYIFTKKKKSMLNFLNLPYYQRLYYGVLVVQKACIPPDSQEF